MGREKSDGCAVPESRRKTALTASGRGGKAATVSQRAAQLELPFETADSPQGDVAEVDVGQPASATSAVPKSKVIRGEVLPAMLMEQVAALANLVSAFQQVASNRGAPGPDGKSIDYVREHLPKLLPHLQRELLVGRYTPGMVRRVWIPKPGGGQRGLGIPGVVDRLVQQAVYQVLSPYYEPTFHASSHGFRPDRSCHTAIEEARGYVEAGYDWLVDLDLEKFFDRVNHQRLLARLGERIKDQRVLSLIRRLLKAKVVMPDGVVMSVEEGVPQGGPLSPLLSNIVLDELDWELARRGHRFVRYADDCNVYVRSERAGIRAMSSIVHFLESRLRLRVNAAKSAVSRPETRHFLGFRFYVEPVSELVAVMPSERTRDRAYDTVRRLTPRNWGRSLGNCIDGLNRYLTGWLGFFWICTSLAGGFFSNLDAHIRRRLRAIVLRQRKRKRNAVRYLVSLGVHHRTARQLYSRRGIWAQSTLIAVQIGLRNRYFADRGLLSVYECWRAKRAVAASSPVQLLLPAPG